MFFYYCFGFQSFIFFLFLYLHQWFKQTKDGICWIKENWFEIGIIMLHNRKEFNHPCDNASAAKVTKTICSFIKQHVFHLFGQSLDQFYVQLMVLIIFLIICSTDMNSNTILIATNHHQQFIQEVQFHVHLHKHSILLIQH